MHWKRLNPTAMVTDMIKWLWGPPASKMLNSKLSKPGQIVSMYCKILSLQREPKLGCTKPSTGPHRAEWDSLAPLFRRWTFQRWNVKCGFLWNVTKVQKFALLSSGKHVSTRVSLAVFPDLSNFAVFIAIHDAYHGFISAITAYLYTDRQPMARKHDIFLD